MLVFKFNLTYQRSPYMEQLFLNYILKFLEYLNCSITLYNIPKGVGAYVLRKYVNHS